MRGIDAGTGGALDGVAHLRQSVRDILTTPVGSRVMRRSYGSRLFELVDTPVTPSLATRLVAATAEALDRWEPRYRVRRVGVSPAPTPGHVIIDLEGEVLPSALALALPGIEV